MIKPKDGLGDVEFAGKIKTQTFKQFQLERLIKEGKVMPASKLVEAKELELQRVQEFEVAIEDEERHKRLATSTPEDKLKILPLTRECFENWMWGKVWGKKEKEARKPLFYWQFGGEGGLA